MFREPPPRSGSLFPPRHTSAPLSTALQRSAPARGEADAQRRTFPPPRQVVAAVRNPVFRRPGCRRHAGTAKPAIYIATPEAVAGCQPPTQHTTPIRQAVPTDSVPLSALRSPPRCKAAQALPSGHTHLESPCPRSRRTSQAQFTSPTPPEPLVTDSCHHLRSRRLFLASCHHLRLRCERQRATPSAPSTPSSLRALHRCCGMGD